MSTIVDGIAISGFRSFGPAPQHLGPLSKVTVLAGENNSGKSNVIRFVSSIWPTFLFQKKFEDLKPDLDRHVNWDGQKWMSGYGTKPERILQSPLAQDLTDPARTSLDKLVRYLAGSPEGLVWFYWCANSFAQTTKFELKIPQGLGSALTGNEWEKLWSGMTKQSGGDINQHWIPQIMERLVSKHKPNAYVTVIPAFRRIAAKTLDAKGTVSEEEDNSGRGLIERLAQMQNPTYENRVLKKEFAEVVSFVRNVLGEPSATISVPHNKSSILISIRDREHPLSSFGTGLEELIVMALYCTVNRDRIVCIEEPELHLHPNLQRKFISYLVERTTNQYLISSHSAHVLNTEKVQVVRLRLDSSGTTLSNVISTDDKRELCSDLGYKPSDLLQTNCVIWVEGPSDRTYLLAWIHGRAPELREGIEFSIMFYGGSTLSFLSGNDDGTGDKLISLARLNHRSCLLMDSDKTAPSDVIDTQKDRLANEFQRRGAFVWVSDCRELENYLDPADLSTAICAAHPNAEGPICRDQFTDNLEMKLKVPTADGKTTAQAKKTLVARKVVETGIKDGRFDWAEKMDGLIDYIRKSN